MGIGWRFALFTVWVVTGCSMAHEGAPDAALDGRDAASDPPALDAGVRLDVRSDTGRTDAPLDVGPLTGERWAWVLTTADVPEVNADNETPGFDLDGRPGTAATDRCDDAPDFTSPITGATDVDNQLSANLVGLFGGMLPRGVSGAYEDAFAAGEGLIGLVVDGVDSRLSDPLVVVHVYTVTTESGAPPALGGGRIAPGQRFVVSDDLGGSVGHISGGWLEATFDRLPLPGSFALSLRRVRIGGQFGPTARWTGEIGGTLTVTDVVELATAFGLGVDELTIRGVAQPDLSPSADGATCAEISAGLTYEAVEALIDP
jgi:hypothetical protein